MKENLTADKKIGAEKYNVSDLKLLCTQFSETTVN